jgi:hypothetical protein
MRRRGFGVLPTEAGEEADEKQGAGYTGEAARYDRDGVTERGGDRARFQVTEPWAAGDHADVQAGEAAAQRIGCRQLQDGRAEHGRDDVGPPGHGEQGQGRRQDGGKAEADDGQSPHDHGYSDRPPLAPDMANPSGGERAGQGTRTGGRVEKAKGRGAATEDGGGQGREQGPGQAEDVGADVDQEGPLDGLAAAHEADAFKDGAPPRALPAACRPLWADGQRRQDRHYERRGVGPVHEPDPGPSQQKSRHRWADDEAELEDGLEQGVGGRQFRPAYEVRDDRIEGRFFEGAQARA